MANKKNKVKFGLQNVYWAKINEWGVDSDGNRTFPAYGESKHLPGAVSLSIDANGEAENFYADNGVYYVINNNAATPVTLKLPLSQPNLRRKSLEKFSTTTAFLWKEMIQNLHSLH